MNAAKKIYEAVQAVYGFETDPEIAALIEEQELADAGFDGMTEAEMAGMDAYHEQSFALEAAIQSGVSIGDVVVTTLGTVAVAEVPDGFSVSYLGIDADGEEVVFGQSNIIACQSKATEKAVATITDAITTATGDEEVTYRHAA